MRSVGNVDLTIGLVNCPVQMVTVSDSHDRKGSMYHSHDDGSYGKVKMPKTCEGCGAVLAPGDISKGYEENGNVVMLSNDDLETVAVNSGKALEIPRFIKATQISPMMFAGENAYRLVPDPKRGRQALATYLTIRQVLVEKGLVGVVQYTARGRNHLAVLRVEDTEYGGVLVVQNMLWPDELRQPAFPILEQADESAIDPRLSPVMASVVDSMTEDWNPAEYRDTYTEQLSAAIEAKAAGEQVAAIASPQSGVIDDVSDLIAKLEQSAARKSAKPAKKAPRRKAA